MKLPVYPPFRPFRLRLGPLFRSCVATLIFLATVFPAVAVAQDSQWVRPLMPGDPLVWGRRDGIVFGLFSPGGIKGPRGLIRVGLFTPDATEPQLLNFIAVEPVIQGPGNRFDRMAFSEMEMSVLDPGLRGKRMWVHPENGEKEGFNGGTIQTLHAGNATVERLSVRIDVERFTNNGAHVYVVASIDSDQPSQLRLSTFAEDDSPPLDELTLTATMGNYERLRLLWLKDRVVDSRELFANYPWPVQWHLSTGEDFAEKANYPLPEMLRSGDGDAIVFCTSSEPDPRKTPGNDSAHWPYTLPKITQYWLVPGHDVQPDLRVRVNARHMYWASTALVLGGVAFENFEVRQRYVAGQTFIFGITQQEPWVFYHGPSHLAPLGVDNPQTEGKTH